jgi:hypothetical protein
VIERSRFAPVQARWKVYVVDECHMLSTAAFNALLKTLEELPPRVVFVLATTDSPKGFNMQNRKENLLNIVTKPPIPFANLKGDCLIKQAKLKAFPLPFYTV